MTKPLFTTKHYKFFSEKIKIEYENQVDKEERYSLYDIKVWLGRLFEEDNPKFSEIKFKKKS